MSRMCAGPQSPIVILCIHLFTKAGESYIRISSAMLMFPSSGLVDVIGILHSMDKVDTCFPHVP